MVEVHELVHSVYACCKNYQISDKHYDNILKVTPKSNIVCEYSFPKLETPSNRPMYAENIPVG